MNLLNSNILKQLSYQQSSILYFDQTLNFIKNNKNNNFDEQGTYLFCYGSNSVEQLKERVSNPNLQAKKAYLPGYIRIFAGFSKKWNGGVASLKKVNENYLTKGSIVFLNNSELNKLDKFEGACKDATPYGRVNNIYHRKNLIVKDENHQDIQCITYIRNHDEWDKPPSEAYLEAIKNNLSPFWSELDDEQKIIIYNHQINKKGDFYNIKCAKV